MSCTRCLCCKNIYKINCIPYSGSMVSKLYFLGEVAGIEEAKASKIRPAHFIGPSGEILDKLLELIDVSRKDIAIANSLRCYKFIDDKPTKKELDACHIHTYLEVKKLKPKLVIALGRTALYQTTGKEKIEQYAGRLLWSDKLNCKVYVINHPASVLYNPDKEEQLREDFKRIPELINTEPEEQKQYPFILVDTDSKFDTMYESLITDSVGFDIETFGLDPYDKDIDTRTLQIGKSEEEIYVITKDILEKHLAKLKHLFETCEITGQDYSFDVKWLFVRYGIFPKHWGHDSCLSEFILTGMGDNDLDFLTNKYNKEYTGYWEEIQKAGGAHKIKDNKKLFQYGASDVGTLFPIYKKQYKAMARNNQSSLYYDITLPCNRVLTKMSLRGVLYDLKHLNKIDIEYEKKAMIAFAKISDDEGVKACEYHFRRKFNPRSSQMVHWLLLDHYELPVLNTTKDENPSVGKEEMKRYAKKYKNNYCKIMELYRSYQNIRNNFLSGVIPKLVDGVAHTTYSLHGTVTSRPNSKDPNLLNIPREKKIKRCIIARPEHQFVCSDEAQLEVRIAAVVYDEPELIKICNDVDKDIHCSITAKAFKRDYDEIYNGYKNGDVKITELRVEGKAIQFGVIYQEGAEKLAYSLGISKRKAQRFIDEYYDNFSNLKQNIEVTKEILIQQGYLDNYFNFRRRWEYHDKEDHATLREGVNFLVQSLAWCLLQISLIKIDKELEEKNLKSCLVLQVYDSVIVEAPDEEVEEVAHIIKDVMENVNKPFDIINRVKLLADVEVGPNLADLKKIL